MIGCFQPAKSVAYKCGLRTFNQSLATSALWVAYDFWLLGFPGTGKASGYEFWAALSEYRVGWGAAAQSVGQLCVSSRALGAEHSGCRGVRVCYSSGFQA